MTKNNFASIEAIISIARKGGMFILVDDEKRENEGDLVISTSDTNSKNINFMAKYGRGLICLALDSVQAKKLNLSLMSPINQSRNKTAFTISIEAKKGITTGISAKDRAKTIKVASKKNANKNEIVSPGHVFPIIAKDGGVLVRAGHTEASVDISKLAKKNNSAVICEIMNEDGTMAKGRDLFNFANKHKLKIGKIEDLIAYRLKKEKLIKLKKQSSIIVKNQKYNIRIYENLIELIKIASEDCPDPRFISFTNQRETFTLFNKKTGKPARNAVVWQCTRGQQFCEKLLENEQKSNLITQKTGLKANTFFLQASFDGLCIMNLK